MRLLTPEIVQHYSVGRMPDRKVTKVYSHTLAVALALSAQAAGAIHLPIVVAYATLVAGSGALALLAGSGAVRGGSHRDGPASSGAAHSRIDVGAGVWFTLALICLLQAVPLPLGWLQQIAPSQADVWVRALEPFGVPPPAYATLSLAPHRTLVEAAKMASYGVIFYIAARLGRHGLGRIAGIAFASGLAVALVTLAHRVLGAERLFGVYTPRDALLVAPLLNPNNLAGYLVLAFFCGLGLLFRSGASSRAPLLGVGLLLLVIQILLCQSRGGTACLVLGMLLVPLLRPRQGSPSSGPGESGPALQAVLVGGIALVAVVAAIVSRPEGGFGFEASLAKLGVLRRALDLILEHPLWGVGRGAFGSAFAQYQPGAGATVFEHAENLPLQWAAEWGVPVALAALAALAWSLWPVLSRRTLESPVRRCALIGAGALLAQNQLDLGLEIPAIAALFVYVLGGLAGASLASAADRSPRPRWLGAGTLLTAACAGLVLVAGSDSPARERERLHARLSLGAPDASFWSSLEAAVRSYPADPYFPLLGASAALAERKDAVPWVARAIERSPNSVQAQLLLARALQARRATRQALGALRRAIELEPDSVGAAMRTAAEWRLAPDLLALAVPDGARGARALMALADASPAGSAEQLRWLSEATVRDPSAAAIHQRLALALQRDLQLGERGVVCREQREACSARAREHAERAVALDATPSRLVLLAQLIELFDGPRPAEQRLLAGCAAFPGDEDCAAGLVVLAFRNDSPSLPAAVRALIAAGCKTRERCAAVHTSLGRMYASAGQWHGAANHYKQATQEWPTVEAWRGLATASRELGQNARAEDALRRSLLLDPAKNGAQ
jgi:tetratricopeptide (TPR) repeat protein